MKIVAIIPARGGSKGIPMKNLVQVSGKPLINWSIEAGLDSKYVTDVVVSSDHEDILANALTYEQVIAIQRPKELAQDNSPTSPVLEHALKELEKAGKIYDYLILLQATSPLRTAVDVDQAFEKLQISEASALISVTEPEHSPLKSFVINEKGYMEGIVNNDFPFMPRQVLPKTYQSNGAIYIIETKAFLRDKSLFTNKTVAYTMPADKSIDIDYIRDIKQVETSLKK